MKFKCPSCHKRFSSELSGSAIRTLPKCPKCGLSVNEDNIHVGLLGRLYAWMFTKREHKENSEQVYGSSLLGDLFDNYEEMLRAEDAVIQEREMHALYSIGSPKPIRLVQGKTLYEDWRGWPDGISINCSGCDPGFLADAFGNIQQPAYDSELDAIQMNIEPLGILSMRAQWEWDRDALTIILRLDRGGYKLGTMIRVTSEMLQRVKHVTGKPIWIALDQCINVAKDYIVYLERTASPGVVNVLILKDCLDDYGRLERRPIAQYPIYVSSLEKVPPGAEYPGYSEDVHAPLCAAALEKHILRKLGLTHDPR